MSWPAGDALLRWRDQSEKDSSGAPAQAISWQRAAILAGGVLVGEPGQAGASGRWAWPAVSTMVGLHSFQGENL